MPDNWHVRPVIFQTDDLRLYHTQLGQVVVSAQETGRTIVCHQSAVLGDYVSLR